jgi:TPR repeat protein
MNKNLIWVFLFMVVAVKLPAQQPASNAVTNITSVSTISVDNPDGSFIGANFDWDTNFIDELVSFQTNAAAATTTNKFFIENKALAEKGDSIAQVDLGWRYFKGFGVTKDFAEAAKWFRKAADQGNVLAEHNLGACYANGFGVPQDKTEASKWYGSAVVQEFKETKALAEQGDATAQYDVGFDYLVGNPGATRDNVEAVK